MSAAVSQGFEDTDATLEFARETIELASKNAFAYWLAWATILPMLKGLRAYEDTGAQVFKPHALTLIADVHRSIGQYREGLAFLDEAKACAERGEIRFYDAEILRVKAELLIGIDDPDNARRCYEKALEIASAQGAESLRLRAEESRKKTIG